MVIHCKGTGKIRYGLAFYSFSGRCNAAFGEILKGTNLYYAQIQAHNQQLTNTEQFCYL
jgi:hypothetical protein